jgi:WD40 repeat protein
MPGAVDSRLSVKEPNSGTLLSCSFNARYRVAAACRDNSVRVYRVDTGARVAMMYGHTAPVNCVVWAPNNNIVASGSEDGRCVLVVAVDVVLLLFCCLLFVMVVVWCFAARAQRPSAIVG